jgi:hypothetical protein
LQQRTSQNTTGSPGGQRAISDFTDVAENAATSITAKSLANSSAEGCRGATCVSRKANQMSQADGPDLRKVSLPAAFNMQNTV